MMVCCVNGTTVTVSITIKTVRILRLVSPQPMRVCFASRCLVILVPLAWQMHMTVPSVEVALPLAQLIVVTPALKIDQKLIATVSIPANSATMLLLAVNGLEIYVH